MALSLSQKIGKIHPSLAAGAEKDKWEGIVLVNDTDGKGDYIKEKFFLPITVKGKKVAFALLT